MCSRLVCTSRDGGQIEISPAYRHVSVKILDEFPNVMSEVASQLTLQIDKFRISLGSRVDDLLATIKNFNRQFQLGKLEQEAVEWGYGFEPGGTMFAIVKAYTRGAQFRLSLGIGCKRLEDRYWLW
jgi:hypothetical protein